MGAFAPNAIKCLESVSFLWPPFLLLLNFWLLFPFSKLLNLSLLFKKKNNEQISFPQTFIHSLCCCFFCHASSRIICCAFALCTCFYYRNLRRAWESFSFLPPSEIIIFFCFEIYARQPGCREINVWHGHRNKILKSVIICKFFNKKKFFPSLRFFLRLLLWNPIAQASIFDKLNDVPSAEVIHCDEYHAAH